MIAPALFAGVEQGEGPAPDGDSTQLADRRRRRPAPPDPLGVAIEFLRHSDTHSIPALWKRLKEATSSE